MLALLAWALDLHQVWAAQFTSLLELDPNQCPVKPPPQSETNILP